MHLMKDHIALVQKMFPIKDCQKKKKKKIPYVKKNPWYLEG